AGEDRAGESPGHRRRVIPGGSPVARSPTPPHHSRCPPEDARQRPMPGFTFYFATDLHGSEQCFRKFLNAGKFYGADAVILGGDVAGKALIPVVSGPGGSFEAHAYGRSYRAEGEDGLASLEARIRALGCYPYRTTPDQLLAMRNDPEQL